MEISIPHFALITADDGERIIASVIQDLSDGQFRPVASARVKEDGPNAAWEMIQMNTLTNYMPGGPGFDTIEEALKILPNIGLMAENE